MKEVIQLANSGVRPRQILTAIHAEQLGIVGSDIRNLLQKYHRDELKGRSPLQALYEDFLLPKGSQYEFVDARDKKNRMFSLIITSKSDL